MALLVWILASCALIQAQEPAVRLLEEKTLDRVQAATRSWDAVIGMAAIDLTDGHVLQFHGDTVFPQASSIKIAIMLELFRSAHSRMDENIVLAPEEAVGGSGRLQASLKKGPVTLTLRQLITAMIEWSDNTATNKCIEVAGMERVNRMLDGFGLKQTRLKRRMMDLVAAQRDEENVSTPMEMARLVELIYHARAAPPDASREMLDIMKLSSAEMKSAIPDEVEVASKPGQLDGVRCETGVVLLPGRPFAISVNSAYLSSRISPVTVITDIVFGHFDRLARANRYGRFVK